MTDSPPAAIRHAVTLEQLAAGGEVEVEVEPGRTVRVALEPGQRTPHATLVAHAVRPSARLSGDATVVLELERLEARRARRAARGRPPLDAVRLAAAGECRAVQRSSERFKTAEPRSELL